MDSLVLERQLSDIKLSSKQNDNSINKFETIVAEGNNSIKELTIIIGRHGRPNINRKININAKEYIDFWANYDLAGLAPNQNVPRKLLNISSKAKYIISSTLPRAIETARAVVGSNDIEMNKLFIEAPLPPPLFPDFIKFSPKIWGFFARCSWFIGFHRHEESRKEAEARAILAAKELNTKAEIYGDVALFAHGWFNRMIRPNLKALGYKCIYDGGDVHWSYRVYKKHIQAK